MKMAHYSESSEPVAHVETHWEGIKWEGRYSPLGMDCVS